MSEKPNWKTSKVQAKYSIYQNSLDSSLVFVVIKILRWPQGSSPPIHTLHNPLPLNVVVLVSR